ncbi:hypothetical protein LMG7053_06148 [Achromobacter ruhlandii]|uniref:Uncharacterized protein n=1 Tax=Achromobacter ruhlandii TaxID=72557 RepID=A0ABM8M555_9BURK|nr:hypothetical protein LMG7053_06148 [Achromobacter ruhlandii]
MADAADVPADPPAPDAMPAADASLAAWFAISPACDTAPAALASPAGIGAALASASPAPLGISDCAALPAIACAPPISEGVAPPINDGVAEAIADCAMSPALAAAPDARLAPASVAELTALRAIAATSCAGLSAALARDLAWSSMPEALSAALDRPLETALAPLARAAPMPPREEPPLAAVLAAASDAPAALSAWPEAASACFIAAGRCTSSAVTSIGSPTWLEGSAGRAAASLAGPIRLCEAPLTENMPGPLKRMSPPSMTISPPAACKVMRVFARISMLSVVEVMVMSWPASISSMSVCAWIDTGALAAMARRAPSCTNRLVERPEALAKVWRAATWPSAWAVACRFSLACRIALAGVARFSDEGASTSMRAPSMRSTGSVPLRSLALAFTACWPPTLPA